MIVFSWIVLSILVGAVGADRKIGFWGSFLWSLLLSPLIGIIIAVSSTHNSEIIARNKAYKLQEETLKTMKDNSKSKDVAGELERLSTLLESGKINQQDFERAKEKILGN